MADSLSESPLNNAIRAGDAEAVSVLLETPEGQLLQERKNSYGFSPLHVAVRMAEWRSHSIEDIVRIQLQAGADAGSRSLAGISAVEEASHFESDKILILLLRSNAELHIPHQPRESNWAQTRAFLSQIFWDEQSLTPPVIWDLRIKVKSFIEFDPSPGASNFQEQSKMLYAKLHTYLAVFVAHLAAAGRELSDSNLPPFYCEHWLMYKRQVRHICTGFAYLDRHLVAGPRDDSMDLSRAYERVSHGTSNVAPVKLEKLCLRVWKGCFLDQEPRLQCRDNNGGIRDLMDGSSQALSQFCEDIFEACRGS